MLVDSHCHIDGEAFAADRDEVVQRARQAGVTAMLNVGTGDPHSDDFLKAVAVAEQYENVFASVGVHPHDAKVYDDTAEAHLIDLAKGSEKVIAWGEIGLDYYYDHSPRDVQRKVFRRQIQTARNLGLPVIIHSRDADEDTVSILKDEYSVETEDSSGIMHCFAGTPQMAAELIDLGFLISFAGNVTFKKADGLRESARSVPLDRLLVETDCPFLTPVPFRGKRNEPAYVVHTARFLADLHGISCEELAAATSANFIRFFELSQLPDQT
jgi:TatD DNase family protein